MIEQAASHANSAAPAQGAATEPPTQLEILIQLYEGAINFLNEAKRHCEAGEVEPFKGYVKRARRIIEEFQNTLNFKEGGQVTAQLSDLYDFMLDSLTQAELTHDISYLDRVSSQLATLLEGWIGVREGAP